MAANKYVILQWNGCIDEADQLQILDTFLQLAVGKQSDSGLAYSWLLEEN